MPPRVTWRNLLPGIIAVIAVASIAFGVLLFAGIGTIKGAKFRLYVLSDEARGVMHGTEVWLAGQKVGIVDGVDFRPPTYDSARVVITVSVRAAVAQQLRRDSRAQLRTGTNIIGPVVVDLSAGTPGSLPLRPGDTIRARAQADYEVAGSKLTSATSELKPLMDDARRVFSMARDTSGTIGALLRAQRRRGGGGGEVARFGAGVTNRAAGSGSAITASSSVVARARVMLAQVDSVRALLASRRSSLGRFQRDSTLGMTVAAVRDNLGVIRARLAGTESNLGRFKYDSALLRSVTDAHSEMAHLFDDIRRRPLRYVHIDLP